MNVSATHKTIVKELKARAGTANAGQSNDSYTGSKHTFYGVTVPERRAILKEVIKANKGASVDAWLSLIDALMFGRSHEEKSMGAYILGYLKEPRSAVNFARLESWLEELQGWAEIDALCYNNCKAEELLLDWNNWQRFLRTLAKDKQVGKRRASLVFLTGPTSRSDDERLHAIAYENIDKLKNETDILITKAISWLLRSMAETRPHEVAVYIKKNTASLPKIAIRETTKKLQTGKKN